MNAHADLLRARPLHREPPRMAIEAAMSGGAAHGAFAWGVLDRLLEEPRISFAEIDATGIGAANAAALAYGLTVGGAEGARRALQAFWRRAARAAAFAPSWAATANPLHAPGASSLRWALEQVVDFERLRLGTAVPLFLSAINLRTGRTRVFAGREICFKGVLAAASLPPLAPAVEIDGDLYAANLGAAGAPPFESALEPGVRVALEGHAPAVHLGDELDLVTIDIGTGWQRDADWEQIQGLRSTGRTHAETWLKNALAPRRSRVIALGYQFEPQSIFQKQARFFDPPLQPRCSMAAISKERGPC
jgi:hypothetical protein